MKQYYMVLLRMRNCIELTSSVPSQEVVAFYRCLLRGLRCEPGGSNKVYIDILNKDQARKGKPKLAIEDGPAPEAAPPPLADDEDGVMSIVPKYKALARGRGGAGRRGAGHPGRGGPRPKAPLPLPPAPPPLPPPLAPVPPVVAPRPDAVPPVVDPPPPIVAPVPPVQEDDEDGVVAVHPVPVAIPRAPGRKLADRWDAGLGGALVLYDEYNKKPAGIYRNWKLKCPRHDRCFKTAQVVVDEMGRREHIRPLAGLHCWMNVDPPPGKTHSARGVWPEEAAVEAYIDAHRDELQGIVDRDIV